MSIERRIFGKSPEGRDIYLFMLRNSNGMSICLTDFGAILVSVFTEDKNGKFHDVVLGFDQLEQYSDNIPYFGSTIGRNANRIAGSSFSISSKIWNLDKNEGENNLHGGYDGYHKRVWNHEAIDAEESSVIFKLKSPHGDQGFPGSLEVSVTYTLTNDNEVKIDYHAVSDQDTLVNLTNHSYFNLGGHDSGDISSHKLWIDADQFTPVSSSKCIPTGQNISVQDSPMDFRTEKKIGRDIHMNHEQLIFGQGYDHNWVLKTTSGEVIKVAKLTHEESGRVMEVYTDLPGVQFYSGNVLEETIGKEGSIYQKRSGLCLETQYIPDAIHHSAFESPLLKAGEIYRTQTIYKFKIEK